MNAEQRARAKKRLRAALVLRQTSCKGLPYRIEGEALHANVIEVRMSDPVKLRCLECGDEWQ